MITKKGGVPALCGWEENSFPGSPRNKPIAFWYFRCNVDLKDFLRTGDLPFTGGPFSQWGMRIFDFYKTVLFFE